MTAHEERHGGAASPAAPLRETIAEPGRGGLLRRHPLASYFVLAFALSWAWWLPLAATGQTVSIGGDTTHMPGLLGPLLAALAVTAITEGGDGLRSLLGRMGRWQVAGRWYLQAAQLIPRPLTSEGTILM